MSKKLQTKQKQTVVSEHSGALDILNQLKNEVRQWYGSLSIRELTMNKSLILEIEKMERLLSSNNLVGSY